MPTSEPTYTDLLTAYKAALLAISTGQSYSIQGRTLTRANLPEVRETIEWLEDRVAKETSADPASLATGVALARFS